MAWREWIFITFDHKSSMPNSSRYQAMNIIRKYTIVYISLRLISIFHVGNEVCNVDFYIERQRGDFNRYDVLRFIF